MYVYILIYKEKYMYVYSCMSYLSLGIIRLLFRVWHSHTPECMNSYNSVVIPPSWTYSSNL